MNDYGTLPANATLKVEPFTAHVPEEKLKQFKQLLELSPVAPPVFENTHGGRSYGLQREWLEKAKHAWLNEFDWRKQEDHINSFPNFKARVTDNKDHKIDVHFIALFSKRPDAIPIMFLHGFPSSFAEFLDLLGLLTKRYTAETLPYHVIVPSVPGFTYSSGPPVDVDYKITMAVGALNNLMIGLGFGSGYLTQGGDLGSFLSRLIAKNYDACKGMHVNQMPLPTDFSEPPQDEVEKRTMQRLALASETGLATTLAQATKPATIGLALSTSPMALLCWIGEKYLEWTDEDAPLEKILREVTLYWLTDTISRCIYFSRRIMKNPWSDDEQEANKMSEAPYIEKPTGYSYFANEIIPISKRWAAKTCNLVAFYEHDRGGHFAPLEKPRELLDDVEDYVKKVWVETGKWPGTGGK